jgi:hypothetical protein
MLGGPDPLDGISVYRRSEPLPHWHFVTYGFSELYAKESADAEQSGYGFELTLRLGGCPSGESPPSWVFSFLQNLARYVFSSGNAFDAGHYMHLNGPMALGSDTKLRAIALASEPELPAIDTPNGRLQFLQVIGITPDELAAIKAWNAASFLELIKPSLPLFVTDLARVSLTDEVEITEAVQAGTRRDGSSTASLFVGAASWRLDAGLLRRERLVLTLGANGIGDFRAILPGRLPHGRDLTVASKDQSITFVASDRCSCALGDEGNIRVYLSSDATAELAKVIVPKQGTYRLASFPNLLVHVVQSVIKDSEGKVVDVVG